MLFVLASHGKRCGSFIVLFILVEAALCMVELKMMDRDRLGRGDHDASKHLRSDKVNLGLCSSGDDNVDTIQANTDCGR